VRRTVRSNLKRNNSSNNTFSFLSGVCLFLNRASTLAVGNGRVIAIFVALIWANPLAPTLPLMPLQRNCQLSGDAAVVSERRRNFRLQLLFETLWFSYLRPRCTWWSASSSSRFKRLEIHKTYLQAYASSTMTTHSRIVRPSHSTRAQSHISVMWMHRPGNPP
jgi:hypothetical protein